MLEEKIMCLGIGLQEYYCVCAIAGLVGKKLLPESSRREEHDAADRVSQTIQRVLALQDNYSAAATLASLPNMVGCNQTGTFKTLTHMSQPILAPNGSNGMSNGNGLIPAAQTMEHAGLLDVSAPFYSLLCLLD